MTSEKGAVPNISFLDKVAIDEEGGAHPRSERKVIQAAKDAGQVTLDAYEKTLARLVDFDEKVASNSELDWVTALANTHAKFVQDISSSDINAARELVK
jgi:hypothetical protein